MASGSVTPLGGYDNRGLDMTHEKGTPRRHDFMVPFNSQHDDAALGNIERHDTAISMGVVEQGCAVNNDFFARTRRIFVKGLSMPLLNYPTTNNVSESCIKKCDSVEKNLVPEVSRPSQCNVNLDLSTADLRQTFPAAGGPELNRLLASQGTMTAVIAGVHGRQRTKTVCAGVPFGTTCQPYVKMSHYVPITSSPTVIPSTPLVSTEYAPRHHQFVPTQISPCAKRCAALDEDCVRESACPTNPSYLQPGEMRPRAWTFGNDRPQKGWIHREADSPICLALNLTEKTVSIIKLCKCFLPFNNAFTIYSHLPSTHFHMAKKSA